MTTPTKGYSPLRRWLRAERAGNHHRWVEGPACPVCDTRKLVVVRVSVTRRHHETVYVCDNDHEWRDVTYRGTYPELTITGSAP